MPIEPNDIIALLEDGPHHADELLGWLQVGRLELLQALRHLHAQGLIRQLVRDGRWALAGYVKPRAADQVAPVTTTIAGRTTHVIDGVEYEVVSLDELQARSAKHWPSRGLSSAALNAMGSDWKD